MRGPSPWIATVIGSLGVLFGATSLVWNFYVYRQEQPGFIIDCARDFEARGSGMGRGAPSGGFYTYDNRVNEVRIPCKIINVGVKAEVIRRVESRLVFDRAEIQSIGESESIPVNGKSIIDITFTYRFDWKLVRSNGALLRVSLMTTTGTVSLEKWVVIYPFY
jgi:hypothetical protein